MNAREFDILKTVAANPGFTQRQLVEALNHSLGAVNKSYALLREQMLIEDRALTDKGWAALAPYKVTNAVIMAAGMSSRFAPLSYEKPKGLLEVKGEVLIERQIRQLHEAGITDITVVLGYMSESFFYLEKKFGVKLVFNPDFHRYNNAHTLMKVLDVLDNTYICSADNYFVDNVFEPYVFKAYYSTVYLEDASQEWAWVTDHHGRITGIDTSPVSGWCMMGHVYFDRAFSKTFKELLPQQVDNPLVSDQVWEYFLSQNISRFEMYARRYDAEKVLEFDSLEDLRAFDEKYLSDSGSAIFANICDVLGCVEGDIVNIKVIKKGFTNLSFSFTCKGSEYVYRHPGRSGVEDISRSFEAYAEGIASENGLDETFVSMDPESGWKLSHYWSDARPLDYSNVAEVTEVMHRLRRLHAIEAEGEPTADLLDKVDVLLEAIPSYYLEMPDFADLKEKMKVVDRIIKSDPWPPVLCHEDIWSANILVRPTGEMTFIDWERSAIDDPCVDFSGFFISSGLGEERVMGHVKDYLGHEPSAAELTHIYAHIAAAGFYWYVWSIYQKTIGSQAIDDYQLMWYRYAVEYTEKLLAQERD